MISELKVGMKVKSFNTQLNAYEDDQITSINSSIVEVEVVLEL